MATYTNGIELARATKARAARLRAALGGIAMEQATAGKTVARGLTHGPQREINAPSPVSPIRPIGRRTGKLFSGWRVRRISSGSADTRQAAIYNRAPHHVYVLKPGGTKRMADRGYWEAHRKASAPATRSIAQRGQQRALRG